MIYTYSTIFLASLFVALISLFFYRAIFGSSKSRAARKEAKTTRTPAGQHSHLIPGNLGPAYPAMPTVQRKQNAVWPYRESKNVGTGTSYKVTRRALNVKSATEAVSKPWGW